MNTRSKLALASLTIVGLAVGSVSALTPDNTKNTPNRPTAQSKTTKNSNTNTPTTGKTNSTTGKTGATGATETVTKTTDPDHFAKLFKSIDTDGNGFISVQEWTALNAQIGTAAQDWTNGLTDPKHPTHAAMLRRFDANKNGTLEQTERETAIREWQNNLINALAAFDRDRDGVFSTEERAQFLAKTGDKGTPNASRRAANNRNADGTTNIRPMPSQRRANFEDKNR